MFQLQLSVFIKRRLPVSACASSNGLIVNVNLKRKELCQGKDSIKGVSFSSICRRLYIYIYATKLPLFDSNTKRLYFYLQ